MTKGGEGEIERERWRKRERERVNEFLGYLELDIV